jgi:hypothetical protein
LQTRAINAGADHQKGEGVDDPSPPISGTLEKKHKNVGAAWLRETADSAYRTLGMQKSDASNISPPLFCLKILAEIKKNKVLTPRNEGGFRRRFEHESLHIANQKRQNSTIRWRTGGSVCADIAI